MMAPKTKRPRAQKRAQERLLRKDVRLRERAATFDAGGTEKNPIAVASAAVVEGRARSTPCPQCGGTLDVEGEAAQARGESVLRTMRMICRLCHTRRRLWFRIGAAPLN